MKLLLFVATSAELLFHYRLSESCKCCVTMKLAVCLMLAVIIPCILSESEVCRCEWADRRYTGIFSLELYRDVQVDGLTVLKKVTAKGTFDVDLDGYYFRADLNHPTLGQMYFYKDDSQYTICYDTPRHCNESTVENQNAISAFPKCVFNHTRHFGSDAFVTDQNPRIEGSKYEYYSLREQYSFQNPKPCKPALIRQSRDQPQRTFYAFEDIQPVAETHEKSFYQAEINKFFEPTIDDIDG